MKNEPYIELDPQQLLDGITGKYAIEEYLGKWGLEELRGRRVYKLDKEQTVILLKQLDPKWRKPGKYCTGDTYSLTNAIFILER